jgi:outer membrane receptor protein involved in Fe transport
MPSYTVFDAGYTFNQGPLRVKLSIDNLFDKDYEQFVGFPAQDLRARLEARVTF